ncbi:MAG: uracil-DNA glycosylase [Alphaproteobacteria bacterium]|nr:uracil-DNA glycosylase [Alphaproteobacteria bacterium]
MENSNIDILEFYVGAGVDETYNDVPFNFLSLKNNGGIVENKPIQKVFEENFKVENNLISISQIHKMAMDICANVASFDELENKIKEFDYCPLKAKSSSTIIGVGNKVNPDLVVLTEIPNAEEDKSGIAFSGDTGELLNKILGAIGLSFQTNVFAMPVMFYRPAGGRMPTAEEMDTVKPFVFKAVELLKPKVILTMGGLPSSLILNVSDTIVSLRGKWADYNGVPVMPTFSLQYILNAGRQGLKEVRLKAWEDVQEVQKKLV